MSSIMMIKEGHEGKRIEPGFVSLKIHVILKNNLVSIWEYAEKFC